jgi:hypothetical protein
MMTGGDGDTGYAANSKLQVCPSAFLDRPSFTLQHRRCHNLPSLAFLF